MNLVKVEVKDSGIDGKGEYTLQDIAKGEVVWKFDASQSEEDVVKTILEAII